MNIIKIKDPNPMGDWIDLLDCISQKYKWDRKKDKLVIKLSEGYKIAVFVKLLNEMVEMVDKITEHAGIEMYYDDILVFQQIRTIPSGYVQATVGDNIDSVEDKDHLDVFNQTRPLYLKLI